MPPEQEPDSHQSAAASENSPESVVSTGNPPGDPGAQAVAELPLQRPSSGLRLLALRRGIPLWVALCAATCCILIIAGLWWWSTRGEGEERLLGFSQLPSITETVEYFPQMWDRDAPERHLLNNTAVSLRRVLIGFSLALLVGVPLGIAAGCYSVLRSFLAPLILFGRNIPVAALTALVFAFFGTGELEKVMFIFIACVAFIIADTVDAIRDVAERYVETALTLGASRLQVVTKVLVPLAMPAVFNSIRVMFGLAFGYIMLVEIVQEGEGAGGLGFMLNMARRRGTPQVMVIIILCIPLVAWLIDQILYVIQCTVFRWKYGEEADQNLAVRMTRPVLRLFWRPVDPAPAVASQSPSVAP